MRNIPLKRCDHCKTKNRLFTEQGLISHAKDKHKVDNTYGGYPMTDFNLK
jgi:hypothetical protein